MNSFKATSVTAGTLGVYYIWLTWNVIAVRMGEKISLGTNNNKLLELRCRGQANFSENVPLCLVLLGLVEMQGVVPQWAAALLGGALTVGRISHGWAFTLMHEPKTHTFFRRNGMILTLLVEAALSGLVLFGGLKSCGVV